MTKTTPWASACTSSPHSTTFSSRKLSPKESRDLMFLYSIMIDQIGWLLTNVQQIIADSDGDLISSWLRLYVCDTSGVLNALPDSLWDGCLADYRLERDLCIEKWWLTAMGREPCTTVEPTPRELFHPEVIHEQK